MDELERLKAELILERKAREAAEAGYVELQRTTSETVVEARRMQTEAEAERDALREDAERYRWLRTAQSCSSEEYDSQVDESMSDK